ATLTIVAYAVHGGSARGCRLPSTPPDAYPCELGSSGREQGNVIGLRAGALACVGALALASAAQAWTPEKAKYGIGERSNVGVTMADGTVLRADVYYPTASSGRQARGRFPVIM